MQAPKRKTSKSKRNMRRAHHAISAVNSCECKNCGAVVRPHHLCLECGHYGNRQILAVDAN